MANDLKWYQENVLWKRMHVRRKYKDRLFCFLFQDKRDLLELYNAVNKSSYENPEKLEFITLDDVIFMKMKNDVSFMVADQLNLYEQQSAYSSNMPLRGLVYFSRAMEDCIQRGILEDILIKNKAEVLHMLLTEYDEKKHMRDTYKEGEAEGYRKGKYAQLEHQVRKKLQRGQTIAVTAKELEEETEVIERIIDKIKQL